MTQTAEAFHDVVVIGAGMGGGLAGRALAVAGLSVLFLERGPTPPRKAMNNMETSFDDPFARELMGSWPTRIRGKVDGQPHSQNGQGVGVGGTSTFYAAALERPARRDFESVPGMVHPTGGWCVGYDEMAPWYDRAQQLLFLNGTADPLSKETQPALIAPLPLSPAHMAMGGSMRARGLHPYRTPLAIRNLPGCHECIGHRCPKACKMDGRSAGVEPALETGRAELRDRAIVRRLIGQGRKIEGVEVEIDGQIQIIRARVFVLAAGAMSSPRLLLASANKDWPGGCANSSGLVGRGLMFHFNEIFAIWPSRKLSRQGPRKIFSLRDFYDDPHRGDETQAGAGRLGLVQSLGLQADYGTILSALKSRYSASVLRHIPYLQGLLRIPAAIMARVLGKADIYAAIVEDLPQDNNRVLHDPQRPDDLLFHYRTPAELHQRRRRLRRLISERLGWFNVLFLNYGPEINTAHACGSLRFSDDPALGVLNRNCRAHDLDNLYVADASFMPSSTGVNPSLTIAANALRVASIIAAGHRAQTGAGQ